MDPQAEEKLNSILMDNESGSTQLLIELNRWMSANIMQINNFSQIENRLRARLGQFQIVIGYLDELDRLVKLHDRDKLELFFQSVEEEITAADRKIYDNGKTFLEKTKTLITISNSNSVLQFLVNLHKEFNLEQLVVCESRPVMEGRIMTRRLLENGLSVRLITEAAMSDYLENIDAAIIGADKILNDGSVINKIGSRQLGILCKHFQVPFYVVADKGKFTNSLEFHENNKPANEIWDFEHSNLKIANKYFEQIESSLITKIISNL